MKLRLPEYFVDVACIGGKCTDSCCVGWELDIDEDTFEYYRTVPGPFGERLRLSMSEENEARGSGDESGVFGSEGDHTFRLRVDGRCPFLNRDNLCDIVLNLGPEALCTVCSEYPRYTFQLGNMIDKSLTLSCPEVGRLIFTMIRPMGFTVTELGDESIGDPDELPESDEEETFCESVGAVRDRAIAILSERPRPLHERIGRFYSFCKAVQHFLNEHEDPLIPADALPFDEAASVGTDFLPEGFPDFPRRLEILEELEVLDERWSHALAGLEAMDEDGTYDERIRLYLASRAGDPLDDYEFLLCYFVNRYFPRAAYDSDVLGKAGLALFGLLTVRDLDAAVYFENGGRFSFSDRIRTAGIYSKEVEHSDENLDLIAEEILFS
jgi:lysine-N-methylase